MRQRPLILGFQNPYPGVPALSPRIANSSGWRLWKMMNDRTGISVRQYEETFEFANLSDRPLMQNGSVVVVLGDSVRRAVGVDKILIHPQIRGDVEYRVVPHPSGRCLFYNSPLHRDLVAMMLEDLAERNYGGSA